MINCKICSRPFKAINKRHLASHGLTRQQYIFQFPDAPLQSSESAETRRLASIQREINFSAETKANKASKISKSRIGKSSWNSGKGGYTLEWSQEAKDRAAQREHPNKGIPISEEQKLKQSKTMTEGYASGRITHWNLGNITSNDIRQKISESCKGYKLTPEQQAKHLASIRMWVNSKEYIAPMSGKKHSEQTKLKISSNNAAIIKTRNSMEGAGYWIPLAQVPAVIKYRREVWKHTNRNAHLIPGYDVSKRGRCSKEKDNWQIDHKLSITQGWVDGVSAEDLSHPVNLQFIPWRDNLLKFNKSALTKEELLAQMP